MGSRNILTSDQRSRLQALVKREGITKVRMLFGVSAETLDKAFTCADGVQIRGWKKATYDSIIQQIDFFC